MNAHMVTTRSAAALMIFGGFLLLVFAIGAIWAFCEGGWRCALPIMVLVIASAVMLIVGAKQPKAKEIKACANGPVSIEQISVVYEVVDVDGKMLTLRER